MIDWYPRLRLSKDTGVSLCVLIRHVTSQNDIIMMIINATFDLNSGVQMRGVGVGGDIGGSSTIIIANEN